eukprot:SAG11_NODE_1587_length_4636_cov_3.961208_1_plen_457_part_00
MADRSVARKRKASVSRGCCATSRSKFRSADDALTPEISRGMARARIETVPLVPHESSQRPIRRDQETPIAESSGAAAHSKTSGHGKRLAVGDIVMLTQGAREKWCRHSGCLAGTACGRVVSLHPTSNTMICSAAQTMSGMAGLICCAQIYVRYSESTYMSVIFAIGGFLAAFLMRRIANISDVNTVHVQSIGSDGECCYASGDLAHVPPVVPARSSSPKQESAIVSSAKLLPPSVKRATEEEWTAARDLKESLKNEGLWDTEVVESFFLSWGGEDRCCLRVARANDLDLEMAVTQFKEICEYRRKYCIAKMNPALVLQHPVKPFWVGELPGLAAAGHARGCVVQVFKMAYVQPKRIVELFTQEELDEFIIMWMERRQQLQLQSILLNPGDHVDDRMLEIYDCGGLKFSQFNMKGLKMLSQSLKLCQANYPEDLCQTYLINVPGFFNFAWNIIKPGA